MRTANWSFPNEAKQSSHKRSFILHSGEKAARSYPVQAPTDLMIWSASTDFVATTGTNPFTDATSPDFSSGFYRAVTQ